jgi:hypothetical protein
LKQVTTRINSAFEKIMPMLLSYSDYIRWDDVNHGDRPIGKLNLVSGQNDYTVTSDENALDILNITNVRILTSATETKYTELKRLTLDDTDVTEIMSPSQGITGVPSGFIENGNTIFLNIPPNYNATNGLQLFFSREQSYFVSTDTTKEAGIPKPFHELLALYASLDWIMVNRTDDGNLISLLRNEITIREKGLRNHINLQNPTKLRMTMKGINFK